MLALTQFPKESSATGEKHYDIRARQHTPECRWMSLRGFHSESSEPRSETKALELIAEMHDH